MKKCCKEVNDKARAILASNSVNIAIDGKMIAQAVSTYTCEVLLIYNVLNNNSKEYFKYTNVYRALSCFLAVFGFSDETICETMIYLFKIDDVTENLKDEGVAHDYVALARVFEQAGINSFWLGNLLRGLKIEETIDSLLTWERKLKKDESEKALDIVLYDAEQFRQNVRFVKSFLFTRMDSFNEDDIEEVYEALRGLKVDEEIALKMKDYFKRILDNRVSLNSKVEPTSVAKPRVQEKHLITDKEYRSILKEIRSVFNPYTLELVSEVDPDKRAYIAGLMARIDLDEQVIKRFLQLTGEEKSYTYEYFSTHIDEFKYYYGEELDDIFAYLEEVYASLNEEDKEYWIEAINEELRKHMFDFKLGSYDYELKKLKSV